LGEQVKEMPWLDEKRNTHTLQNIKKISARHLCVYLRPPTNAQCGKFPLPLHRSLFLGKMEGGENGGVGKAAESVCIGCKWCPCDLKDFFV